MNALVLGGVGAMGVHVTPVLIASGVFKNIVVADLDLEKARRMAGQWGLPTAAAVGLDASDESALRQLMAGADVVVNALPKGLTLPVARATIAAGLPGIDLSSLSPELRALDEQARSAGTVYVAGCGSSSGLTNMLAKHGARLMEVVEAIEINFASFRAIALSPSSIRGVFWEFGPDSERGYFADGSFRQVALFEGMETIDFAPPICQQTVYIVPHSEAQTLPRNLGAKRVVVRGTFPPKVMRLMMSLVDYGFFKAEPVVINGSPVARRELMAQYLAQVPEAKDEPIWGYGLYVTVIGRSGSRRLQRTLWTTHPSCECPGWIGPEAWAKCVALPLAVGSLLLARHEYAGCGVDAPEAFLPAAPLLEALRKYGLEVHESEQELHEAPPSMTLTEPALSKN
jgi:saccharopine dehydrogenase-like NADP-dependent oxidoreductase